MAGIDHFTKQEFEDALPVNSKTGAKLWQAAGLLDGEYVYIVPVVLKREKNPRVVIEVRSSVGPDGHSANTGDDSIRAWLNWLNPSSKQWEPLGSTVQKYVTRLPGWEKRMVQMIRTLYGWRIDAGDCPKCGNPKHIFKVIKDGENHGRIFAKCPIHDEFRWLDLKQVKEEPKPKDDGSDKFRQDLRNSISAIAARTQQVAPVPVHSKKG